MKGTVAALSATDYKDPPKVLVPVNDEGGAVQDNQKSVLQNKRSQLR